MALTAEIIIPPRWASRPRRVALKALHAVPAGQLLAFKIYNKLTRTTLRHRQARTYFGALMECDLYDFIPMCIFHFGVWEPHISGLIQSRLAPGDVFCDVGANIGYDSLLAAEAVGSDGRVVAIEPSPSILEKLNRNLRLNATNNVRVVSAAITGVPGTVTLWRGHVHNSGTTSIVESVGLSAECEVPGYPLTDILSAGERARLRLVKIDVEGAERPILMHLLESIGQYPDRLEILVEMSATRDKGDALANNEIFDRFSSLGFQAYSVPNSYEIIDTYINFRSVERPTPIESTPQQQQDVFFSRTFHREMLRP